MVLEWLATLFEKKYGIRPTVGTTGPISEGSHGYMAQIRRVHLEWPVHKEGLPNTVVIKCPVAGSAADAWLQASGDMDAEERAKAAQEKANDMKKVQEMCHAMESQVYGLFDDNYPAPCPMPKTYASFGINHDHPSIVMEDITGATVTDIVDGWTEKQLYTILDCIVNLHVMSFTTEKWKTVNMVEDDELMENFAQMTKTFAAEINKNNPLDALTKVQEHVLKNSDWFKGMYKHYENHPMAVFVHGDMWAPQFLWRGDSLAAIVDWQLTHTGSFMEDFLRLVPLGVLASERTRLNPILLHYYYDQLTAKLATKGAKTPFTFDEMMEEYKSSLPYACGSAVFAFCMWSNSPVLKRGDSGDEARIAEMYARLTNLLEECVNAYGW